MTDREVHARAGQWVGDFELGRAPVFMVVTWQGDENTADSVDLPGELVFRLPTANVRMADDRLSFEVVHDRESLAFDGRVAAGRIEGSIRMGARHGTFRLRRTIPLGPELLARAVGNYRVRPGETALLALTGDGTAVAPFYARGDRLVPLYPLSPTMMLSELNETLTIAHDEAGAVRGITWRGSDGSETFVTRLTCYQEEEVRFDSAGAKLAGTLLTPFGDGPHPAIVLMHGTMPSERHFYRLYADHFARRGVAALIYDKRGSGASTGGESTIAERAADALAGLHFLQTRPEIDRGRVGLWGFSNSTWSLPWAAARSEDVAFLIATGAAGVTMARAETHRRVWELREWGVPEETLAAVERAWTLVFTSITGGHWEDPWDGEWDALVEQLRHDQTLGAVPLAAYALTNPRLSPVPPLVSATEVKAILATVAAGRDMGYDPVSDYARVTCPVLFIAGALDGNLPAEESAARVADALARAGNVDVTVMVIPDAGHTLNVAYPRLTGASSQEASAGLHGFRFAPGYLALMIGWLLDRVRGAE